MKKIVLYTLLMLLFTSAIRAEKYPVEGIPEELIKNAKAVVRKEVISFSLNGDFTATQKEHKVITVLNENGYRQAVLVYFYDKFKKIKSIDGAIYNAEGEEIEKIKSLDILDVSAVSNFSIYEDNRIKVYQPNVRTYPFTIEYEVEIKHDGIFNFPIWHVFKDYNVSTEKSYYSVEVPESMNLNYYTTQTGLEPEVIKSEGKVQYKWKYYNFKSIESEDFSTNILNNSPAVYMATDKFELEGVEGSLESWQALGEWMEELQKEALNLPPATVQEILELTKGIPDTLNKIAAVYKYMQDKTRYVSIQIGIGGWKPFDAATVDRTGYGDCKALTNYTRALLKAAGIDSYYTVVRAGKKAVPMITDFTMNQFNHAILCVPHQKDTIWLECTSQDNPFAYLGPFTDDRDVLVINEKGQGEIAHTTKYGKEDNRCDRYISVKMDQQGKLHTKISTRYSGLFYEDVRNKLINPGPDAEKELYENLPLSNFKIISSNYQLLNESSPLVQEKIDLEVNGYMQVMGTRRFFSPNMLNKLTKTPAEEENRISDVFIRRSYMENDTVILHMEEGLIPEAIPENTSISSDFGNYTSSYQLKGDKFIYIRHLEIKRGQFSPEEYPKLTAFFKDIYKADHLNVVFVKQ